jgi:hypothetical protein
MHGHVNVKRMSNWRRLKCSRNEPSLTTQTVTHNTNRHSQHKLSLTTQTVTRNTNRQSQHKPSLTTQTVTHNTNRHSQHKPSLTTRLFISSHILVYFTTNFGKLGHRQAIHSAYEIGNYQHKVS